MIKETFKIPLYDIDLRLVQLEKGDKKEDIMYSIAWGNIEKKDIEEICENLQLGETDGGDTWRNLGLRKMMVVFYPFSNEKEMVITYSHEKRHVEDRIMQFFSVDDIESAGILAGYLGYIFFKFKQKVNNA